MIEKRFLKARGLCQVTFEIPEVQLPAHDSENCQVFVVGDFNAWDTEASPMQWDPLKRTYRLVLELEPEREYQFRYLVDGRSWCNDWHADGYVAGPHGAHNGVIATFNGKDAQAGPDSLD